MSEHRPVTITTLQDMKRQQRKISMLTAYDATFARVMNEAGIDSILVGDSLGNVAQGLPSTLSVTVDHIVYHTRCVARGAPRPLLIADMPFMSYHDITTAAATAQRLIAEGGASMVKLEGGGTARAEVVKHLSEQGVAICCHLGLTPQWVHRFGGFRVQGRQADAATQISQQAQELESAGAQLMVLEGVPAALAQSITEQLSIPVIGIGAGVAVDGQVLVMHDMLGMNPRPPRFVRDFLATGGSIHGAVSAYIDAVREGSFPQREETYHD